MLEGILGNLLAQAIWELALSPAMRGLGKWLLGGGAGKQAALYQESVDNASAKINEVLEETTDRPEDVYRLLETPEIRTLVKSLYLFTLADDAETGFGDAISEFRALWHLYGLEDEEAATAIFQTLVRATDETLQRSIEEGILSAHEAKSAARHRLTVEHLEALARQMSLLAEDRPLNLEEVAKFEDELRREVGRRHAHITPPDFYGAPRVEIDRLYVLPNLATRAPAEGEEYEELTIDGWLDRLHRAVLLGNPGAGKSTLSKKLCHLLANRHGHAGVGGRPYTPALVVLRQFAAVKKDRGISIRAHLEELASASYQLTVPDRAFEYLLLSGRLMVIFDGLDELLETARRQEIRDDVESFCRRYPDVPVVVTSRLVGYEQAPLEPDVFDTLRLSDFSEDQIAEYAHKWFALDASSSDEQREKADAFIEESRTVPDLRVNPLLLALMCNFYRGQNYLPRNLPDVYENCARMLFETWDRSRGIEPVLPIAEHIRPAMRYLAYWIYEDQGLQTGVTEPALVERAVSFLLEWRFDEEHSARHAAEAFIEFCRGRAWVFTDVGSTAAGEPLYQFTHRTFLEYFAADHLVSTLDDTAALRSLLRDHIAEREWDVVAQIAYQLRGRASLGAASELLEGLLADARSEEALSPRAMNLLSFAARSLAFLVPRPAVARAVAEQAIEVALEASARRANAWPPLPPLGESSSGYGVGQLVGELLRVGPEHLGVVVASVKELLINVTTSQGELAATSALVASTLLGAGGYSEAGSVTPEAFVEWEKATEEVLQRTANERQQLAQHHPQLALMLAVAGESAIPRVIDLHGPGSIFALRPFPLSPSTSYSPIADTAVVQVVRSVSLDREPVALAVGQLEDIARALLTAERPWITNPELLHMFPLDWLLRDEGEASELELSNDTWFGILCALAPTFERLAQQENGAKQFREGALDAVRQSSLSPLAPLLKARVDSAKSTEQEQAVRACGFTPDQDHFVNDWVEHLFDLLAAGT